jgi:regulator of CtrA degradation
MPTEQCAQPEFTQAQADAAADFAASEVFRRMFQDGMEMVEETAAYLDGPGRSASRELPRKAALAYAGESMRLTTRLMQVASWLLVQRAIQQKEMPPSEAAADKYRLGAREVCLGRRLEVADLLPPALVDLLDRSEQLYLRVDRMDQMLYRPRSDDKPAGALSQLERLQAAFGARGE